MMFVFFFKKKKEQGGLRCLSSILAFPFIQSFRIFCLTAGIPIAFLWPRAWVTHWNSKLGMLRHPPRRKVCYESRADMTLRVRAS